MLMRGFVHDTDCNRRGRSELGVMEEERKAIVMEIIMESDIKVIRAYYRANLLKHRTGGLLERW